MASVTITLQCLMMLPSAKSINIYRIYILDYVLPCNKSLNFNNKIKITYKRPKGQSLQRFSEWEQGRV